MTNFKPGDRVRYTNARNDGNRGIFDKYIGIEGVVTQAEQDSSGHVNVRWDDDSAYITFPYIENLELVERAPVEPNYTTQEELRGICSLVAGFNDLLPGGNINGTLSIGNTAVYDSNGDVMGYVAFNSTTQSWVFYDPSFKNEV